MANLIFKKGTYADFKAKVTTAQEGAFYLTEDEGGLYVGLADGSTKRIQGSVLIYDDIDAIVKAAGLPPYDPNVIYFSAKDNALFRYDAVQMDWIQLNQTAESVTSALTALQNSINNVQTSLNNYKTSNDAAIAKKADQTALDAEITRAKAAEAANASAAAAAQTAADEAQETADTAVTNAAANATKINGLTSDLATVKATAESKTTMAEVEAKGYATVAQVNSAKSEVIGSSSDSSAKNTIYGAKAAAAAAQSAAEGAQSTANSAQSAAATNAEAISDEVSRAKAAEATLNTAVSAKVDQAAYNTKISALESSIADNASAASSATTIANAALARTGGTMSGEIKMGNNKISGLATPTADADAANKKYVDDVMAAADAMVFQGVLGTGTGMTPALPTSGVQKGWTYKVGTAGTYGSIAGKVGDLIINTGEDNATPVWVHVTSGYEDDYLQKLSIASNSGVEIRLNDGISSIDSKIVLKNGNGIEWTVNGTEATPSIVWGTF